ncbi:alpha/beta hydrolase [Actinocorallia sp. A-T 12471]|uniref:alpha/beta hydrolase n=1 Tax=Actinocorallia sp. A-T 12471 TaxID=3089813 RepID=UPI0029D2BB5E|nr:alpha/beta hydrolase [Actinocorallia sp. A-T 12471]MDX6738186.1 alpha/beta hydrolase [Actinocorallia sp. A-T 12471]
MRLAVGRFAGAGLGLVLLGGILGPAGGASAAGDPFAGVGAQKVVWENCFGPIVPLPAQYKRLECATIKAPLDWRKPKGKKITLAFTRLKAKSGKPKGVLFTNPGGPGGYGLELPLVFAAAGRERMLKNLDIIGIDVRGTGLSTQARCPGMSYARRDPRVAGNLDKILADAKKTAKACQKGAKKLPARYVTTHQTVHDLEWIRRNLRDSSGKQVKKIDWLGFSGGTWLGAHYARYFPQHSRRFVLDSNVDFTSTWKKAADRQPKGFQDRFVKQFAPWAAKNDKTFGLGTTASAVIARYEEIRTAIAEKGPIEVDTGGGWIETLDGPTLDNTIASAMYVKYMFAYAADTLAYYAAQAFPSSARTRPVRKPAATDPYAGETPTYYDITCNDTRFSGTPKDLKAQAVAAGKKYPLIGYYLADNPCQHWKFPAKNPKLKRPAGVKGPRLLMIQSALDPATPLDGAEAAHAKYRNSRLVVVKNEGDHGVYLGDNPCVNRIVESYLLDGTYPKAGTSCKGQPIPDMDGGDIIVAGGRAPNPLAEAERISGKIRPYLPF